jgi:hypothetical protein
LDLHADDPHSSAFKKEKLIWEKLYRLHVQELGSDVYESDGLPMRVTGIMTFTGYKPL